MCEARESGTIATEHHRLVIKVRFKNLNGKRDDRTLGLETKATICRDVRGKTATPLKRATMSQKPADHH
jgi:hypothetical protein